MAQEQGIAARVGVPVTIDPDLREMSLGALEGMPHAEAMQRYPQWAGRSYLDMLDARMPQGGESVRDLSVRVLESIERVAGAHAGVVEGRWPPVVIYAHNTVARVLLGIAAALWIGLRWGRDPERALRAYLGLQRWWEKTLFRAIVVNHRQS